MGAIRGSEGCFGMNVFIDDELTQYFTDEYLKDIVSKIILEIKDRSDVTALLEHMLMTIGTYTPDELPCSDCGTWGGEYVIELNN